MIPTVHNSVADQLADVNNKAQRSKTENEFTLKLISTNHFRFISVFIIFIIISFYKNLYYCFVSVIPKKFCFSYRYHKQMPIIFILVIVDENITAAIHDSKSSACELALCI